MITTAQYLLTRRWKRVPAERMPSVQKDKKIIIIIMCKLTYYLIRCVGRNDTISLPLHQTVLKHWLCEIIGRHTLWPLTVVSATRHWKIIASALQICQLEKCEQEEWWERTHHKYNSFEITCATPHPENYHKAEHGNRKSQFSAHFPPSSVESHFRSQLAVVPALLCYEWYGKRGSKQCE